MPSGICVALCCKPAWWDGPGRETESPLKAASAQGDKHHKTEAKRSRAPADDLTYSSALSPFLFLSLSPLNLKQWAGADELPSEPRRDCDDGWMVSAPGGKEKENPYKQDPEVLTKPQQSSGRALPDSRLDKKLRSDSLRVLNS